VWLLNSLDRAAVCFAHRMGWIDRLVSLGAIICSIIGLFYYLRVVKVMYFDAPAEGAEPLVAKSDFTLRWLLSINALGLVAMIGFSGVLYAWCQAAFGV
jgi:NADH-quinone oxidoreductase subunit N